MFSKRSMMRAVVAATIAFATTLPVAAQTALETVTGRGTLRVGMAAADPWFYKDPISQEWTGVGVEMGKAMAAELGVEFAPVETTWANSVAAI